MTQAKVREGTADAGPLMTDRQTANGKDALNGISKLEQDRKRNPTRICSRTEGGDPYSSETGVRDESRQIGKAKKPFAERL